MGKVIILLLLLSILLLICSQDLESVSLDYSSTIDIHSDASPLILVSPYSCEEDEAGYCVGVPEYKGVETFFGKWTKELSPFVDYKMPASGVLQDELGVSGSQANLTYELRLGDVKGMMDSKKWLKNSTKVLAKFQLDFQYGWTDDNYVVMTPKGVHNAASLARGFYRLDKESPLSKLVFGEFYYIAEVEGKTYWGTIPPKGHPIHISVHFHPIFPSLEDLWVAWIKTIFMKVDYFGLQDELKLEVLHTVLPEFTEGLQLDFDYKNVRVNNITSWMLDCSLPKNKNACKFKVLDDADHQYNSLMWALGRSNGLWSSLRTVAATQSTLERAGLKRLPSCYKNKVLDQSAVVVVYCNIDEKGDCLKTFTGREVTHVASFNEEVSSWTSKLGMGPLIMHDSPLDIKGYGAIKACFARG